MRRVLPLLLLLPGAAHAHASERMVILTLPTGWFIIGAAVVVALTALMALRSRRLPAFAARRLLTRPPLLPRSLTSWAGALVFWSLIAVGVLLSVSRYAAIEDAERFEPTRGVVRPGPAPEAGP